MESERLTQEELDALDEEVGQRVMGWSRQHVTIYQDWQPAQRIECAWAVVEALVARGWDVRVVLEGDYRACLMTRADGPRLMGSADTAPLAIVRAALRCADWEEAKARMSPG